MSWIPHTEGDYKLEISTPFITIYKNDKKVSALHFYENEMCYYNMHYFIGDYDVTEVCKNKFSCNISIVDQTAALFAYLFGINIKTSARDYTPMLYPSLFGPRADDYVFYCEVPHKWWIKLCITRFIETLSNFKNIPEYKGDARLEFKLKKYIIDKDFDYDNEL